MKSEQAKENLKKYRREYMRKWRAENKEKISGYSRKLRDKMFANATPEEVERIRKKERDKTKKNQVRTKEAVFSAYGGYKCACCGETEKMFLTIDHINNDGHIMRKQKLYSGNGTGFYLWLKKNNFPTGFQVLCMNCQIGKYKNGGVCPHQCKV